MRTHTSDFKEKIKLFGRQIKGKIIYYHSYDLISESDDNILTEADLQIISEQANYDDPIEIDEENIFSISIIKNGDLLQSLMKEFDFEVKDELNIGSVVNPHFGLLTDEENQTYEYLDYGNYIVNSKEFNMDTQTWSYVCFDKMLFAMVKYRPLTNVIYPITIKQYINLMCNKVGLEFEDTEFVNQDQLIYEDLYEDKGLTYRDVFDEISKIVAGNLLINDSDKLEIGYVNKISYSENVSGSNITIEAKEEKLLNVKLEGDMQQEGIPTPSNPQDVEVVTGEQNIKILGKNLFNIYAPYSNSNATNNVSNNELTITCTKANSNCYTVYRVYNISANATYNFSYNAIADNVAAYLIRAYKSDGTYTTIVNFTQSINLNYNFTTPNEISYLAIFLYASRSTSGGEINNKTIYSNIQLEMGNSTSYEPYQSQNYPINLGNIEYCKLGTAEDKIYQDENGDWYFEEHVAKKILNGTENWILSSAYTNETILSIFVPIGGKYNSIYKSNKLPFMSVISPSATEEYVGANGTSVRIGIFKSRLTEGTVTAFKTWLSQNNIKVYFELATPTTTQITDTSLIQQLNNFKNATLFNGTNNINVDGYLPAILNLDYVSEYESINEEYLKDTNVKMAEKFGVINSVAVLDTDNDLQYVAEDTQSIKENELTRITITDNLIALNGDTQTIADNVLSQLNGLYYYINDFTTTGVCYFDFLDMFNVEARGNIYQCLLLNNEITISQGIEEHIFTQRLEESETSANEYTTSVMTNKQVQFKINQQEGKIESKVEKDGVISAINQSAEEIQINASKLSFEGATINMTADNVKIEGENLDIDSKGTITLKDNSAASSLNDETLHSAYIINSTDTVERAGTIETLNFKNEIVANGRKVTLEDNWEYQGTTGGGKAGITEAVYSQPRLKFYAQSNDYDPSYSSGSYQDLDISLNAGISYTNINNGVLNIPLTITSDGRITCVSVTQTSKEENKKNFERLINAKEILNATDIYKYNMTDEEDDTKKHIGFVIGQNYNYSQDITSIENNGVDIYSMVSVLWQVVKEQQEEINELKEMIKNGKY